MPSRSAHLLPLLQEDQAEACLSHFVVVFECFDPPCYCTVRYCMSTASLLQSFITLSYIGTSSAFNFQPAPLIFVWNCCGCIPLALVQNCIIVVVAAHGNEVGWASSFSLREGGHLTYLWYKLYCLPSLHSIVIALLPLLKYQHMYLNSC